MPNNDNVDDDLLLVARGGEILTADARQNIPANDAIASTMVKGCRSVCILIILPAVNSGSGMKCVGLFYYRAKFIELFGVRG